MLKSFVTELMEKMVFENTVASSITLSPFQVLMDKVFKTLHKWEDINNVENYHMIMICSLIKYVFGCIMRAKLEHG